MRTLLFAFVTTLVLWTPARAEEVCVKYGPCPLDLSSFTCNDITRSSFINRVCYDAAKSFMVVELRTTYYPYCSVPQATVDEFLEAQSMGRS